MSTPIDQANPLVGTRTIDENGTITGLDAHKGETVFVLRAPKLPHVELPGRERAQKAIEAPMALAQDFMAAFRAHQELSRAQYKQFTEKYGTPADLVREYANRVAPQLQATGQQLGLPVTPAEMQAKMQELNTLMQKRLDEAAKEMNARYEKIEMEFDATVERLFKGTASASASVTTNGNGNGHHAAEASTVTVTAEADTDATPRKASKKNRGEPTA
ncbi:MAG TPA: hypothetical protein VNZ52_14425 [Candidatus Thermoplasmatota archaeon]|nr:hypothetical protein [Candidatus Thermoplasmatota archaeon]